MVDFIIAITFILIALSGWIFVQYLARKFATRHPEFGPPKEEGGGCGKSCMCSNGNCKNRQKPAQSHQTNRIIKSTQENQ